MGKYKIEIKWAFINAAMFLLWMAMEKLAGLHDKHLDSQPFVTTLILIPSIILYVLAVRDKKKHFYSGNITYKRSFMSGFTLTVFIVILSPVNQLITSYIITPDYFNNAIEYTVKSGVYTLEQTRAQFNIRNYMITSVVGGLLTGIVISAIISIFTKSKSR